MTVLPSCTANNWCYKATYKSPAGTVVRTPCCAAAQGAIFGSKHAQPGRHQPCLRVADPGRRPLAGKGISGVRLALAGPGRRQAPAAEKAAETAAAFLGLRLHLASLALLLQYQDPPAVTQDSTDKPVINELWAGYACVCVYIYRYIQGFSAHLLA